MGKGEVVGEVDIARPADLDVKTLSLVSLRVCNRVIGGKNNVVISDGDRCHTITDLRWHRVSTRSRQGQGESLTPLNKIIFFADNIDCFRCFSCSKGQGLIFASVVITNNSRSI